MHLLLDLAGTVRLNASRARANLGMLRNVLRGFSLVAEKISAIIPTHNRMRLLGTTLLTVMWQRDVDLEVIVVDDGSTEDVGQWSSASATHEWE